jgi:tRNA dimethylallyltransferase
MRRVLAIVGATATGKTGLGEAVALAAGGEVVCADARQVFGELEVGTGKPRPDERARLPHHLFDALAVGERASAGWYGRVARERCGALLARGVTPVLVGGSGLYLRALLEGLDAEPPHDPAVRERIAAECAARGIEALHERLARVDPETAARLAPRDTQRITRALEVFEASGRPLAWWHAQAGRGAGLEADVRVLELTASPGALAARIARRTQAMFAGGLIEETRALMARGLAGPLRALHAIGYDEAMELLAGHFDRERAESLTSARTRQLAKRQRTWFRHQLRAERLEAGEGPPEALLPAALAALGVD